MKGKGPNPDYLQGRSRLPTRSADLKAPLPYNQGGNNIRIQYSGIILEDLILEL